jgi:hypothetical protein
MTAYNPDVERKPHPSKPDMQTGHGQPLPESYDRNRNSLAMNGRPR